MDDDVSSALEINRRLFITGAGAAVGYAMAAGPVQAEAINTPLLMGFTGGEISIPTADGRQMAGYMAMPARPGPHPVVLVVQEIFGVHEYIRDICRRLARWKYMAIAPELYFRQGDPKGMTDIQQIIGSSVSKVPDSQVMSDLDATADWAVAHGGDPNRLGITGFCWGGRMVWLYAAHSSRLKAGVAWYGRLTGEKTENTPLHPLDLAGQMKAPVLGLYGGADAGIPVETVEQMRAALRDAYLKGGGVPFEFKIYPDAPHAFHADYRPSYREDAAKDGWNHAIEWLQKYKVSSL